MSNKRIEREPAVKSHVTCAPRRPRSCIYPLTRDSGSRGSRYERLRTSTYSDIPENSKGLGNSTNAKVTGTKDGKLKTSTFRSSPRLNKSPVIRKGNVAQKKEPVRTSSLREVSEKSVDKSSEHREPGAIKGGWFQRLSHPMLANLKRKVNEKLHRESDDCAHNNDVISSRPSHEGVEPRDPHVLSLRPIKGASNRNLSDNVTSGNTCDSLAVRKLSDSKACSSAVNSLRIVNDWKAWKNRDDHSDDVKPGLKRDCKTMFLVVDLPCKLNHEFPMPEKWAQNAHASGGIPQLLTQSASSTVGSDDSYGRDMDGFLGRAESSEREYAGRQALYERLQRKADARKAAESRERTYDDTYISRDANANDVQPESNRETPCQDTEIRVNVKKRHSTHQVFGELPESVEAYCGRQTKGEPTPSDGTITLTYSGPHDDHRTDSDTDNDDTPRPIPPALGVPTPPRKNSFGLHAMAPLYRGRISVLEAEKEVLLEMNATLRDENEALRRMTCLMTKGDASSLDVEQPNASNGDSRPSEISLLPRLSHGRLPSLATLTRINLRFNREHHGCLHRAVLNGNEEEVESFLSAGKDINAHDEYGKTPLHCAVGAQKLNIVLCLLSYRPDIDAHDDRDDTPLHTAVRTGNIDIVKALLKEGHADSNKVGNAGCTPLHVAAQLEHANNVTICQILLDHNAKLLSRDHKYMTPIAHAALHGSYDVMISLFHHAKCQGIPKDDLLFEVDGVGSTLLHLAVESGSARVVELCLDEGAAPHSVKSQDGSTPVHLACSYGYMDILDILMKAVAFILDPPPDQDGMLPIHRAAQSNHHEVIAYLLKQDTDQVDAIDHLGRTPIMLAAENGCFESVRVLLDHNANVDIRDSENKTVLHYAIGVAEILKEILKDVKANSLIRAKDRLGNTPLHYAARHGCVKDVSIILMKYKASAAIVNGIGEIPLHIGARNGWIAVVKKLTEGRGKRTMNANDANERTPLHLAAREGHDELVEFFLKRGARIDRDVQGQTPLHYAARQGSKKALELILENKPDCLNVTDKNQNTAIHMAALGGHAEILEFLLSKPEQVVSVNERNQNILDIAIEERHENVAMKIAENKRWKEVVRSTVHGTYTQIQLLVRHMPAVAKKFLDRCVETEGDPEKEDYKVSYDLKFIQGMPDERKKTKYIRESLIALHTMVKYERLECLTHPLCSVLMDIKWRKFGLVCAFLNQAVYLIYISLIMVIMQYIVSFTKHNMENVASNTTIKEDPLIVKSFRDDPLIAAVAVVLIIACVYNLAKEFFQMFDEGWNYFFSINNWMEVTLYVMTFVTIVRPRGTDLAELAVCVFLAWIVLLHYISKFNYVGLYIVMIRKTVMTVFKVLIILLIFLAAFAFSFHVITVPLTNVEVAKTRFSNLSASLAATFFMILDNLRYDEIVLNYSVNSTGTSTGSAIVLNILFISYCFMMPIIFLNLLIGLAVGDIDNIRKTAAMERYTSQVEHLSQLERALPTFILSKVQVTEYVEHPNRKKNFKDKIVNLLVMLLSPRQEQDKKLEHQTNMEERVQRHEAELRDISAILRKHSVFLEELRDLLQDRKIRGTVSGEGVETGPTNSPDTNSEFFV